MTVHYNQTEYTTTESDGFVELCVVVDDGPVLRPFNLSVTTAAGMYMEQDYVDNTHPVLPFVYINPRVNF